MFVVPEPGVPHLLRKRNKLRELERLDKITVRATVEGESLLVWEFGTRQNDHRQAVQSELLPDPAQKCDAVLGRQAQVQQYQAGYGETFTVFVGAFVFQIFLRFCAIFDDIDEIIRVCLFKRGI